MEILKGLPVMLFPTAEAWEAWLEEHHRHGTGIWLKIAKKGTGETSVSYAQALDAALCYGWIDGQKGRYDEQFFLQRFTPRRPTSVWSQVNRAHVARLIEAGRMREAGLAQVAAAQADGRWEAAYASQKDMEVPADLLAALEANPEAQRFFETLNKVNRYALCYRIGRAKRQETRAATIEKFVAMLARGEKLHP